MAKLFSRICACFGLEVVHIIIVRRSRHGDMRLLQSTFPPDHPTVRVVSITVMISG
jgi:hypothetical protein